MKRMLSIAALAAAAVLALAPAGAEAAARPAAQPSDGTGCGWTPANDQEMAGYVYWSPVNIRTGQGTQCAVRGEGDYPQVISVHCYTVNPAGEEWYYIHDLWTGVTGWVIQDSVVTAGTVTLHC